MMRFALVATVALAVAATMAAAQTKNICSSIKIGNNVINPASITPTTLRQMKNRDYANSQYTVTVNVCATQAGVGCSTPAYISVSNASGCIATFDTVQQRPSPGLLNDFKVVYGSSASSTASAELMVFCYENATAGNGLVSRSGKFATTTNKNGGVGYLFALGSHVVCGSRPPSPPSPSSDMPSGGSSNMPSGGSSSNMPSGGSSNQPSGGSSNQPSGGSSNMPSGGSNSNQPSGGNSGGSGGMPSGL